MTYSKGLELSPGQSQRKANFFVLSSWPAYVLTLIVLFLYTTILVKNIPSIGKMVKVRQEFQDFDPLIVAKVPLSDINMLFTLAVKIPRTEDLSLPKTTLTNSPLGPVDI